MENEKEEHHIHSFDDVLKQVVDEVESKFKTKTKPSGIISNIDSIDKATGGFQQGELIVIAGDSALSANRNNLVMEITQNTVFKNNSEWPLQPVMWFSTQEDRHDCVKAILAQQSSVDVNKLNYGRLLADDWPKLSHTISFLQKFKLFIDDSTPLLLSQLIQRTKNMVLNQSVNLSLIVVDNLQSLIYDGNYQGKKARMVDTMIRLKLLANELNVCIIVLSDIKAKSKSKHHTYHSISDLAQGDIIAASIDHLILVNQNASDQEKLTTVLVSNKNQIRQIILTTDEIKATA